MKLDRLIDALDGTEQGKTELKLAYKKAFKLGAALAICGFLVMVLLFFIVFPHTFVFEDNSFDGWALFMKLLFSILPPLVLGGIIGSISLNFFTRHLKITLPEAIRPTIEMKNDN